MIKWERKWSISSTNDTLCKSKLEKLVKFYHYIKVQTIWRDFFGMKSSFKFAAPIQSWKSSLLCNQDFVIYQLTLQSVFKTEPTNILEKLQKNSTGKKNISKPKKDGVSTK